MKKYSALAFILLMVSQLRSFAQKIAIDSTDYQNDSVEMADVMRSEGKIYVLLAIILLIFIGFLIFMFRTEQKIKKIEKEHKILD